MSAASKVTNYMTDVFVSYGFEKTQAMKTGLIIHFVYFAMTLVCTISIERAGRRTLLLTGLIGLFLCLVSLALLPVLFVNINYF